MTVRNTQAEAERLRRATQDLICEHQPGGIWYVAQQEDKSCVLCGAQGTHESKAGVGWVCDSDHSDLD